MKIQYLKPKIKIEELKCFENTHGVILDNDFKSFLLKYDGGNVNACFTKNGKEYDINLFYSFNRNKSDSITYYFSILGYVDKLPFGCDNGGNSFCIGCKKDNLGKIYYVNNDRFEEEEEFTIITKNFKSFVTKLKEVEETVDVDPDATGRILDMKVYKQLLRLQKMTEKKMIEEELIL